MVFKNKRRKTGTLAQSEGVMRKGFSMEPLAAKRGFKNTGFRIAIMR